MQRGVQCATPRGLEESVEPIGIVFIVGTATLGIVAAIAVAWVLKRSVLRGGKPL